MLSKLNQTIFLFGEAEKGAFCTPILFRSVEEMLDLLGNAPNESLGILYAVQALMYKRDLIYFRVEEEGFSYQDYLKGMQILEELKGKQPITALCMPGVGDSQLIEAASSICKQQKSMLIVGERDLYDYLTLC